MSTLYTGSPRDLIMHTAAEIESHLHELKGSTLHYKIFQSDKLLKLRHLLAENEVIGRCDISAESFGIITHCVSDSRWWLAWHPRRSHFPQNLGLDS
jgi:hypothetical protein